MLEKRLLIEIDSSRAPARCSSEAGHTTTVQYLPGQPEVVIAEQIDAQKYQSSSDGCLWALKDSQL